MAESIVATTREKIRKWRISRTPRQPTYRNTYKRECCNYVNNRDWENDGIKEETSEHSLDEYRILDYLIIAFLFRKAGN
jgi:hypothetical protein